MTCYSVEVPDGAKVTGVTARGSPTAVLPGQYLVHQLPNKVAAAETLFRFVGADALGQDVHVPFRQFADFLGGGAPRLLALELDQA